MPANLVRRGTKYAFRRAVPVSIRASIGKREIKISLGSDYRVACREAAILTVETDKQFLDARSRFLDEDETEIGRPCDLHQTTVTRTASRRYTSLGVAPSKRAATGYRGRSPSRDSLLSDSQCRQLAQDILHGLQRGCQPLSEYPKALPNPSQGESQASKCQPESKVKTVGWDDLFERWRTDRNREGTRTVEEVAAIWKTLVSFAGKIPPAEFTRAMATDWLKKLHKELGNRAKTLEKKGTLVGAIFSVAVKDEILERNPFAAYDYKRFASKIGTDEEEGRAPFDRADLEKIFHPVTGLPSISGSGGGGNIARLWIPLIALFTGARLDEIANLRGDNFFDLPVPYFKITKGKTIGSVRSIPVHPKLIELGLIDYAKHRGGGYLFPGLQRTADAHPDSEVAGKWFNRVIRAHFVKGQKNKVFHSLRHTFKDACRNADIPRDIHQALTGHASSDVGDRYGAGHSIETKARHLAKLDYEIQLYMPSYK